MPFLRGDNPIRRTLFHLMQGKIFLRDQVGVVIVGLNEKLVGPQQKGITDFIYWHWAQMQFHNPGVQLVKLHDTCITPYVQAFLKDGREVLLDIDGMGREEIETLLQKTLGKSALVKRRESLEAVKKTSPAEFGEKCERQCICEVQGQMPCPYLIIIPKYLRGNWRWNHNIRR